MFLETSDFYLPEDAFIRIKLGPYILVSKHLKTPDFIKQQFYIPIHNHFNDLKIEILYLKNESWFWENKKE